MDYIQTSNSRSNKTDEKVNSNYKLIMKTILISSCMNYIQTSNSRSNKTHEQVNENM